MNKTDKSANCPSINFQIRAPHSITQTAVKKHVTDRLCVRVNNLASNP